MTFPEAKKRIEGEGLRFDSFIDWMVGQTVGVGENGEADIYEYDVERFIRYSKRGVPETSAEFD